MFYLIHAVPIMFLLGLPWLLIRKLIENLDLRRLLSSLVLALAFTPTVFGGDFGIIGFMPVIESLARGLLGYFPPPLLFSVGSILFVWLVIFAARSALAMCFDRSRGNDTELRR